jgi:5-methyltetrahydrofolate--homocysteine methyltransferase
MADNNESVNLQDLSKEELLEMMMDDLYDGLAPEIVTEVNECLRRGMTAYETMTQGLVAGMDIVGQDFGAGILFVPEVLMAAKAMKAGMEILRPLLTETGAPKLGKAVIGTVKGDIHDIGKNLVGMMWEGAGIEVFNLGINTDADSFIKALEEHDADILGMSALLTTTMPYMKVVIDELKARGLRDKYIVLVGGAPLNAAFAEEIEADAYCQDAAVATDTAKKYLAIRRGEVS